MFINPKTAIERGWVQGIKNPDKQIQPNAIDFTLDKAFHIEDSREFFVSEQSKVMKGSTPYEPHALPTATDDGWGWAIGSGSRIDCLSDIYCDLPGGVSAMLVIRSTLARNGLILTCGLYDSGFRGHIGFLLHNPSRMPAYIAKGTRVGQIIFVLAESAGTYAGGYNHEHGTDLEYQSG